MALIDNLISYWDLEEASGTRPDAHGTNHLTDNNTVGSAPGVAGQAAFFSNPDFQNEHLSCPDNASLRTGDADFSFACWFRASALGGLRTVFSKFYYGALQREYVLHASGTTLEWINSADGVVETKVAFPGLATGTWYFAVCWHDAAADKVYLQVDNGPVLESSFTAGGTRTSGFFVGGIEGTIEYRWYGEIDALALWKRVLTSAERAWLYNDGAGRSYAELASNASLAGTSETPHFALTGIDATGLPGAVSAEAAAASVVWTAPSGALGQPGAVTVAAWSGIVTWNGLAPVAGSALGAAGAPALFLLAGDAALATRKRLRSAELSLQPLASISISLEPLHRIEISLGEAL